jgi:hypothetical protein
MPLRVYTEAKLLISQDNSANPQEPTFNSGAKNATDTTTYNESTGLTFDIAAGAVDVQIPLGSIAISEIMYLMAKGDDISVKLVPVGAVLADVEAYEMLPNVPAVLPFKVIEVYVSNSGTGSQKLILGAAGN